MTRTTDEERQDLTSKTEDLARRITANPEDPDTLAELDALEERHGEFVLTLVADSLTRDVAYSQQTQDVKTRSSNAKEIGGQGGHHLDVVLAGDATLLFMPDQRFISFLFSLIPADFYRAPTDAKCSRLESDALGYHLRGYSIPDMVEIMVNRHDEPYTLRQVSQAFTRAKHKIYSCPSMGFRTVFAEEMLRGRHTTPPNTMSFTQFLKSE